MSNYVMQRGKSLSAHTDMHSTKGEKVTISWMSDQANEMDLPYVQILTAIRGMGMVQVQNDLRTMCILQNAMYKVDIYSGNSSSSFMDLRQL